MFYYCEKETGRCVLKVCQQMEASQYDEVEASEDYEFYYAMVKDGNGGLVLDQPYLTLTKLNDARAVALSEINVTITNLEDAAEFGGVDNSAVLKQWRNLRYIVTQAVELPLPTIEDLQ